MVIKDTYFSITKPSTGTYKDKGSKFLAFAFPVSSEQDVKNHLISLKKKYNDARHHCYAYKLGAGDDNYRTNDDGEPSGTAGKPIYGQILSNELSDLLIVVVRYFGGTLLGTSGLINAYKSAAKESINNAKKNKKVIQKSLKLTFEYNLMSTVMKVIKEGNLNIQKQDFRESCALTLNIRLNEFDLYKNKFERIYGVNIKI